MKVRTEEEIQSVISKGLKCHNVYNMFYSNIPGTKLFKPLIILSRSKVKDNRITIQIWGQENMG